MIGRAAVAAAAALALLGTAAAPAAADAVRDRQWYLSDLDIGKVQQISQGAGVTVALIDTGVDAKHRDLLGSVLPGHNTEHGTWNDSTGREDLDGHGTNMAGIIAGRGHGTGDGILGIAPAAKILPISAPVQGRRSNSFMTEAIDFAIDHHVGVINMSFGSPGDEAMHNAIRKAQAADIVLVGAAGNRDQPGDYPGKYPEVLTVGAYGENHKIASFSVTGPHVDIAAPGDRIVTTGIGPTGYDMTNGTSEATAVVSGAAALIRAKYPRLSAAEVVHRLTATADDAGPPGRDDTYGYGRLNLLRALTAKVAPLPATSTPVGSNSAAPGAPAPTDAGALPKPASALLLAEIVAGLLLAGAIVVAIVLLLRRRRAL